MATHIIMFYPPQENEDLEDLFNFLSACSDADLRSALEEAEGPQDDSNWQRASNEFHSRILEDAYVELDIAREELMLAKAQMEQVISDLESLQVLEEMSSQARRVHDDGQEKLARIEKLIKYFESHEANADQKLTQAKSNRAKLEARLAHWTDAFASELEANYQNAKSKFEARGITIDEAIQAVDDAQQAVDDAKEVIKNLQ
ncbi:MAG: hypothetical protein IKG14_01980 [Clostridia bacterium]|nr:hypothetical protein [Bacilli bacterium]MBR3324802.1 hypothetical protein [Clostridia bacterium]